MARNYEKNFSRLNRLWLEKGRVKKESRPKLSSLNTCSDVLHWLPSIKQELDFFLKQTEVPCYSENKIDECRKRILHLEAEYKAFVRKSHQLNPSLKTTSGTIRPYVKKEKDNGNGVALHPMGDKVQLTNVSLFQTPVLMHDHLYHDDDQDYSMGTLDESATSHESGELSFSKSSVAEAGLADQRFSANEEHGNPQVPTEEELPAKVTNALGLDYSSSEEDA